MDYKEIAEMLRHYAKEDYPVVAEWAAIISKNHLRSAATAIANLLGENQALFNEVNQFKDRAEAAEALVEKAESNAKYQEGVAANWRFIFFNESQARREAEARCKRLDEARERANEACAKWEYRAEKAENQLREAKHCTAGLSMLIKAIDGKMVMETVLPIARRRLSEYKERFSPEKVVLDSQKEE